MDNDKVKLIWEVAEQYRPAGIPIKTPVKDFDDVMDGGVRGGEMITISGLSGDGKTSFALWLTKQISESGVPALFFTYEMNPWYLKEKLLKMGCVDKMPIFVPIEHTGNSTEWLRERIKEAKEKYGCGVVFIDHLHYLIPDNQERNSSLLIGGIARNIKQLALETDTVIYLIAHMRKLDTGEKVNHYAVRDSALIINESDYVFLVERLKRKIKRNPPAEDLLVDDMTNFTKIHLSKNRRTGGIKNRYFRVIDGQFGQLTDEEVKEIKDKIEI